MRQRNNVTPKRNQRFLTGQAIQRGVSIYLALVIMFALFGIGLGISTLLVGQIRMISGMGDSVVAIYAADTGIERVLYAIRKEGYSPSGGDDFCSLGPYDCPCLDIDGDATCDATYTIKIKDVGPPLTITSKGTYQGTNRAIEITID